MNLTPEDRDRIYEDEKYRREVQGQLSGKDCVATQGKRKDRPAGHIPTPVGFLIVGLFAVGLFYLVGKNTDTTASATPQVEDSRVVDLNGRVGFGENQFTIYNDDAFDWEQVRMEVNGGIVSGGYELKVPTIKAREAVKVGSMNFAKKDGERFNPFSMKPQKFFIECDTPQGRGHLLSEWK